MRELEWISFRRPHVLQSNALTTRPQGLLSAKAKFVRNHLGFRTVVMVITSLTPKLSCCGGYFYLWYELNAGQCTKIMSRGRGHLEA